MLRNEIEVQIDAAKNIRLHHPGSLNGRTWVSDEAQAEAKRLAGGREVEYLTWRGNKLIFLVKTS